MVASVPQTTTWTSDVEILVTATNDATGETVSYQLAPVGGRVTFQAVLDSDRTTFDDDELTVETHAGPDLLSAPTLFDPPLTG